MKSTTNLKYGIITSDFYGHSGAIYSGDKVMIKEIKSDKIKVETITGKIYWLNPDMVNIA
jgi:hypothetical protein